MIKKQRVGWVERSETHRNGIELGWVLLSLYPYIVLFFCLPAELVDCAPNKGRRAFLAAIVEDKENRVTFRRVCFRWADGDAFDVEIVDYH